MQLWTGHRLAAVSANNNEQGRQMAQFNKTATQLDPKSLNVYRKNRVWLLLRATEIPSARGGGPVLTGNFTFSQAEFKKGVKKQHLRG